MRDYLHINVLSIILAIIIFLSSNAYGQNDIDSLKKILPTLEGIKKINTLNKLANHYLNNDSKKSISYATQALNLSQKLKYKNGTYKSYNTLGNNYLNVSDYEESLKNYQLALEYITKNNTSKNPYSIIYNNMGNINIHLEKYEKGKYYFNKGLELLKDTSDIKLHAILLMNKGVTFNEREEYDSAFVYYNKAKEIYSKATKHDKNFAVLIDVNIANSLNLMNKINVAYNNLSKVEDKLNYSYDKFARLSVYLALGSININLKKYNEAENALNKVIVLADSLGEKYKEMNARLFLALAYEESDRLQKAIDELYNCLDLKDSILTESSNRQILELETKYNTEKKLKEIELLKRDKTIQDLELKKLRQRNYFLGGLAIVTLLLFLAIFNSNRYKNKTNNTLRQINAELEESKIGLIELNNLKDNLIRLIGHDLKSPLNAITGFSELLYNNRETNTSPKNKEAVNVIYKTSISVNQLLDNILIWSKLQRKDYLVQKENFNCLELSKEAISPYLGVAKIKNIEIQLNVQKEAFAFGDKMSFSIILGNLICNAIKFTKENGIVNISSKHLNNCIQISVNDNGIGIPDKIKEKLFKSNFIHSTKGTKNEGGTGFGLKLCKQFIELNNGKIEVESQENIGSTFFIYFPLN